MAPTTLFQILVDQDAARLRVIAQQWHITLTATRPVDQAAELADSMARADVIENLLNELPASQRDTLNGLLRSDGVLPWGVYTRQWGHVRTLGYGKIEREELWKQPESAAEALWFLGLVQRTPGDYEGNITELAFVPDELRLYIPPPPPAAMPPIPQASAPNRVESGADQLADDLVTWWSGLHLRHVEGGKQAANTLMQCMHSPVQQRQALLRVLSFEQGWVRTKTDESLRPTEAVITWLKLDTAQQWQSLIKAWINSAWDDLAHVPSLAPDPSEGWYHSPDQSRQRLLTVLKHCEADTWYELDTVLDYIKQYHPFILRPDGNFDTWALRRADNGIALRGYDHWDEIEGAYVRTCLTGPMVWLGMVEVGYVQNEETLTHLRLSNAGYASLHEQPFPDQQEPERLHITEQGKITVPARRRYERFQLNRVAVLANQRTPYVYRFTPSSLSLAQQQRISLKRIVEFLETATAHAMPDKLKTTLQAAFSADRGAEITVQWLLRVPDAESLMLPAIQPYIQERLGNTTAIIKPRDAERLLDLLTEHGILTELKA